jgi:cyclophilin family peptidyl-prolyl cis-trans isomerase
VKRAAALFTVAFLLGGCGGGSSAEEGTTATVFSTAKNACRNVPQPKARPARTLKAPSEILAAGKTYLLTFRTSCGDFSVKLDTKASPKAAASLVALAKTRYFDGTTFHRIVPGFVIQGGDPTGRGTGGPGYTTVDTPARTTRYRRGTVAMAKTEAEAPGTAGSQFFVVTAPDAGLPPAYAVVGHVVRDLPVVLRIGVLGDPNTELPTQPVVIDNVRVTTR